MDTNAVMVAFSAVTGGVSAMSTVWQLATHNKPKPKVVAGRIAVIIASVLVIAYVSAEPKKSVASAPFTHETAAQHYEKGRQYFYDHNRPLAIKEAKRAIEIEPTHEEAHKLLGACYGVDYDLDAAAAEYQEAANINPDDIEAQLGLATAEEGLGERTQAATVYRYVLNHPQSTTDQHEIAASRLKALNR